MAQVQEAAQFYTEEDWDTIRAKMEANADLVKEIAGEDVSEADYAQRMVGLISQRRKLIAEQKAKAQRDKPMTQAQQRQYMATYLKNQGGWKLAQIKKLTDEELKVNFEYLMRSMERFVPMDIEKARSSVPKEKDKESVKREEEFEIKKPVLRYTKRKSLARKGLQKKPESAKSGTEEDVEAYMEERVDEPSSEEFPMSLIPQGPAPAKIVKWQIIKTGKRSAYQIVREDNTDVVYVNFQGLLNDLTRDDLKELYRLMMLKYGDNRPEEEFERVLWGDLKTMFDPPSEEDAIWKLPHQQQILNWRYFHSCSVHCLTVEAAHIYMLTEVKYPLPPRVCKAMLEKKLLGDRKDESTMSNRHKDWLVQEQTALGKDFSNPFMADNLPKIVWLSTHHIYVCKELASPQVNVAAYSSVAEKIIHVAVKCWPCCLKDLMLQISLVMISRVADRSQEPEAHNEDTQRNLKFTSEDQVRGGLLGIIVNRLKSGSYRADQALMRSRSSSCWGVLAKSPPAVRSKYVLFVLRKHERISLTKEQLTQFVQDFDIPQDVKIILLKRAYGGKPTVNLLRSFLNLGRVGDWLTLSNRGCANVPIALVKPITHLANWKGNFFYVENRIIPSDYLELLLESNKFDKKSFGDKAGLKNSWKHIPKEPVIYYWGHGIYSFIDGEFKFLSEGCIDDNQGSPSSKSINNEALVIYAKPLTSLHPSNFFKDVADFDDASAGDNENPMLGTSLPLFPMQVAYEASDPLDVDNDADIHGMLLLSFRIVFLDNVLNSRIRELIYALHKATTSFDAIRARELKKDITYAELERKCNESLLDLNKNLLVADMRTEIETLQGRVDGLHSEYRLKLSKIQLLQEMDALKQDRASVIAKVVPDAATKLIRSEWITGYRPYSKQEYDQAGDDLATASYPFLFKYVNDPYASLEQLLSKKHESLRSKPSYVKVK
ncbi:hypothetical protein Tco_0254954 [Tanacetum coccineum]